MDLGVELCEILFILDDAVIEDNDEEGYGD